MKNKVKTQHIVKLTALLTLSVFFQSSAWGQGKDPDADTMSQVARLTLENTSKKLFVHYDKNIYLPNEIIWFSAYRLTVPRFADSNSFLTVVLVRNSTHAIIIHKKFQLSGRIAAGSLLIPDSLLADNYSLIAYTNYLKEGKPDEMFIQPIAIKRPGASGSYSQQKNPVETVANKRVSIKFYPEGGNLIANIPSFVGWETRDLTGRPVPLKAVLMKDGQFIDTIRTAGSGMGKFFVNPKSKSTYTVKIIDDGYNGSAELPLSAGTGVAITLPSGVIRDTLTIKLVSTTPGRVHIVVHNLVKVFYALPNIDPANVKFFKIPLDSLPKGLATITVFNDHLQPCAERLFFAHYGEPGPIDLKADAGQYKKRQKVVLKISFKSTLSKSARVSLACVQASRVDQRYFNDIDSYRFLNQEIDAYPVFLNVNDKKNELENILLVHGWRRFTDTAKAKPVTRIEDLKGLITVDNKRPDKSVVLTLMAASNVSQISTDKSGRFTIDESSLVVPDGKTIALFATGENRADTRIQMEDLIDRVNQELAEKLEPQPSFLPVNPDVNQADISPLANNVMLQEVRVKARKDDQLYNVAATPGFHTNACGDYVCMVNAVNCPFPGHWSRTSVPVKGHKYLRHVVSNGEIVQNDLFVYDGCETKNLSLIRFDGINLNKEFYAYRQSDVTASEPLYNSTLDWVPQLTLSDGQPSEVSFYTGDVAGMFKIFIQGITDEGTLFNETQLEVVK